MLSFIICDSSVGTYTRGLDPKVYITLIYFFCIGLTLPINGYGIVSHLRGHRGREVKSPPPEAPKGLPDLAKTCPVHPLPPPNSLSNLVPRHLPWQHAGLGELGRGCKSRHPGKDKKDNLFGRIRSPIKKIAFDNKTQTSQKIGSGDAL